MRTGCGNYLLIYPAKTENLNRVDTRSLDVPMVARELRAAKRRTGTRRVDVAVVARQLGAPEGRTGARRVDVSMVARQLRAAKGGRRQLVTGDGSRCSDLFIHPFRRLCETAGKKEA